MDPTLDPARVRQIALKMLARREYGRDELARKLVEKGCAAQLAADTVAGLATGHLVSDERFVAALVRARREQGYGPLRILHELTEKGIGPEIAGSAVAAGGDWLDEARRVHRKRFGGKRVANVAERAKQARFLQYRGFTFEQIHKVLGSPDTD